MSGDNNLEARIRRLEDRHAISECVIRYATSVDRADWEQYATCFTDTVHIDFSQAGLGPAREWARDEWVGFSRGGLEGYQARQHLSPNHVIDFEDDETAVCHSYMYAQHYLPAADDGDMFTMHGAYTNRMRRTAEGWRIAGLTQHLFWASGNTELPKVAATPAER